ncbi:ArsR/SmtB family transcription factor [Thiomicrorhabdus arctica]|uniref:ArsR/SmtB family transcription factor n=1 Tax=Thiomicrorhabdus arctica TaxID=131540 RepID=UPI000366104E|nr:metalloregulator ArsR/SmtB family transcription factor [Thiomicrorhabdus arctica]
MNQLEHTSLFFKSLSEPVRLRILNLLIHAESEICVCDFMVVLEVPQSVISRHLAYLRKANLVSARREGVWMHYSISPSLDTLSKSVLKALKDHLPTRSILSEDLFKQVGKNAC